MLSTMTPPSTALRQPAMPLAIDRFSSMPERLLFASCDLDETRSIVGRVMKPHRLAQTGGGERLDARMHYVSLGDVSVSRLRYGAAVEIQPGPLESFFLVQMPLSGRARIDSGGRQVESAPGTASVLSPDDETCMHWSAGTDQLMLRIARPQVERVLVGHLGRPLDQPLRFELGFQWQDSAPWRCLLSYLLDCATQHPELAQHKLLVAQIEQLAALILLTSHQHNHSETAPARRGTILPRHVRRAQDYLQAHAHEPVCADQLADVAGVSVRSLYAGFKEFLGVSPMQYLRDLRMERVRTELLGGEASNVAGIALRWGFAHLGRFSSDYKQRYGESPSQTLRRH
ncbi:AraC family transcriptional regulator [Paracidovorax anthurii]|uniref:AraC-like DNA-binding protein n=1 Tax=Paracidovorax anthurii TaxID=78229 RepID=A0A328ZFA2_9BURK|nr:AraC family transcriptional regulator [Paracidovorax anthurii]RAR84731.1 AraC-like DNA-binding protein [Paracidovorax anthurii]